MSFLQRHAINVVGIGAFLFGTAFAAWDESRSAAHLAAVSLTFAVVQLGYYLDRRKGQKS